MQAEDRSLAEEMNLAIREASGGNKGIFTRLLRGRFTPYKFSIACFPGNEDIRRAVRRGGGIVVLEEDIDTADFLINTRRSISDNSHRVPICHPRFITHSIQAGKVLNYNDYLIGNLKNERQLNIISMIQSSPKGPEDDVIVDVRRLYGESDMDAEDCLVDSFLSSQSRSISEYKARAPESPSAQSTNSVDISDSDYRIKQGLDRSAVDVRDIPAPSSPLGREMITAPTSEPYFDPSSPSAKEIRGHGRAGTIRAISVPDYKPTSAVAEKRGNLNARPDTAEMSRSATGQSPTSGDEARVLSSGTTASRNSDPTHSPLRRKPVSPELEVPTSQTPMTSEFVFVKRGSGTGVTQRSIGNKNARDGNAKSYPDNDTNFADISEDEHYPDPLSFLAARSPNPLITSHLRDSNSSQEATATSPELTSGTPVRGTSNTDIDRISNDAGRVVGSARQAHRRMSSWRGIRKRRRTSSNETGYGEQPVPVVVDRRALSVLSPSEPAKQQSSQPLIEDRPLATLRSRSVDGVAASSQKHAGFDTQLWSASKRIRMSETDSSNDSGDINRNTDLYHTKAGTITPYTASALESGDKSTMLSSELSSPPRMKNTSVSGAQRFDGYDPNAIVLADESSSYPTTNSSAPPVLSVDDPGHIVHVSQTPDASSQDASVAAKSHGVEALSPLSSSSSQLTEPIPDQTNDVDAAAAAAAPTTAVAIVQSGSVVGSKQADDDTSQRQASGNAQIENGESSQAFSESYVDQLPMAIDSNDKNTGDDDIEFNITKPTAILQTNSMPEPTPVQLENQMGADSANDNAVRFDGADPDNNSDGAMENLAGNVTTNGGQTTPQRQMLAQQGSRMTMAATENIHRTSARLNVPKRRSLGPDTITHPQTGRQRKSSASRRMSTCQRLQQLNKLCTSDGRLGIQMDPALAPPARLLVNGLHGDTLNLDPISTPSTPSRRATFSGAMRVLGECDPVVTDTDRLRYMCKLKGLIDGTELSAREALQTLYFFTGDWVSARRYIVLGKESLSEDCMWSAKEDEVLLQGMDSERMEELRKRKGNVEVYRRLQFLNTFHDTR
ncbi:hypothetical protein H4R24_000260 [Coemansia sp. RSA 988]|nr:hypothetical protein H4R24_000260 [Coemansia sp. RSA 988]